MPTIRGTSGVSAWRGDWLDLNNRPMEPRHAGKSSIDVTVQRESAPELLYTSGGTGCIESMVEGCWCGRRWFVGEPAGVTHPWSSPAFDLLVTPSKDVPAESVVEGWGWESASDDPESSSSCIGCDVIFAISPPAGTYCHGKQMPTYCDYSGKL